MILSSFRRQIFRFLSLVVLIILLLFLAVDFEDLAAAYAINIHFVLMVIFIIMGIIGLHRLNLKFTTILKEIRSRASKGS